VVGELEWALYAPEGLLKFEEMARAGDLQMVYPPAGQGASVRVYEVR
jgi:hypothetical protein